MELTIRSMPAFKRKLIEVHSLTELERITAVEDLILVTFYQSQAGGDEFNSKITSESLSNECATENSHIQFVKMVVDCCPG